MRSILKLLLVLCISIPVHAQALRDADLDAALLSMTRIQQMSRMNDDELDFISKVWSDHCGKKSEIEICMIEECDLNRPGCRPDRILLFRGEDNLYEETGTSALLRASLMKSEYTRGHTLSELLEQFTKDLGPLRTFEFAPQSEQAVLSINSKTGERKWFWKDSKEPVTPYTRNTRPRTAALTSYSFHVEASFLYYRDDDLKQTIGIDPLISFTSNPKVARSFSKEEPLHRESKPEGRVIVLSVPKSALVPLCDRRTQLKPGALLDPRGCKDPLNEYTDEQELDGVLYPRPEWIYQVFVTQ